MLTHTKTFKQVWCYDDIPAAGTAASFLGTGRTFFSSVITLLLAGTVGTGSLKIVVWH